MGYYIINRRGKNEDLFLSSRSISPPREIPIGRVDPLPLGSPRAPGTIRSGEVRRLDESSDYPLMIRGAVWAGTYPTRAEHHHVITPARDVAKYVVSVEQGIQDLRLPGSQPVPTPDTEGNTPEAARVVGMVVQAMLGGLSTGLSAAGPKFAPASGVVALVGGLIGTALGATDQAPPVPSPLTQGEIESALSRVIDGEMARRYAVTIVETIEQVVSQQRQMSFGAGGQPPAELVEDVRRTVESAFEATNGSSFRVALAAALKETDIGIYMLNELVAGVAVYISLWRLHMGLRYIPEAVRAKENQSTFTFPVEVLDEFAEDIESAIANIKAVVAKLHATVERSIDATGLRGTPESVAVACAVTAAFTRDPWTARIENLEKQYPKGAEVLGAHRFHGYWGPYGIESDSSSDEEVRRPDVATDGLDLLATILAEVNASRELAARGEWPAGLFNVDWSELPAGGGTGEST